jgi:hypothetical protein
MRLSSSLTVSRTTHISGQQYQSTSLTPWSVNYWRRFSLIKDVLSLPTIAKALAGFVPNFLALGIVTCRAVRRYQRYIRLADQVNSVVNNNANGFKTMRTCPFEKKQSAVRGLHALG